MNTRKRRVDCVCGHRWGQHGTPEDPNGGCQVYSCGGSCEVYVAAVDWSEGPLSAKSKRAGAIIAARAFDGRRAPVSYIQMCRADLERYCAIAFEMGSSFPAQEEVTS